MGSRSGGRRSLFVVVALVTTLLGTSAVGPADAQTSTPIEQVVQLGDSYSAGYGALASTVRAGEGTCTTPGRSRPDLSPGGQLAAQLSVPLVFAACGGAEIPDVAEQYRSVLSQIPGDGSGTVVVFTAGGNDLRTVRGEMWTDLVTRCILWDWSCERRSKNAVANQAVTAAAMRSLVQEITATRPGASVRVLGYPELMQRTPGCSGMTGIDGNEADYMDRIARDLNDALEMAVAGVGTDVAFVNPEAAFDDRGACQTARSGLRFVNDVEFVPWRLFQVAANSLHPTAAGYDAYAQLLAASV